MTHTQPNLFSSIPPHNRTPTSRAAALDLSKWKTDRDRNAIVTYLFSRPQGATRGELEEVLGIAGDTLRPRLKELLGEMTSYISEPVLERRIDPATGKPVTRVYGSHKASEVIYHRNAK